MTRLDVVTKDRVSRFGGELLFLTCRFFGVEVVVLVATADSSREQRLTEDLVEILTFGPIACLPLARPSICSSNTWILPMTSRPLNAHSPKTLP